MKIQLNKKEVTLTPKILGSHVEKMEKINSEGTKRTSIEVSADMIYSLQHGTTYTRKELHKELLAMEAKEIEKVVNTTIKYLEKLGFTIPDEK